MPASISSTVTLQTIEIEGTKIPFDVYRKLALVRLPGGGPLNDGEILMLFLWASADKKLAQYMSEKLRMSTYFEQEVDDILVTLEKGEERRPAKDHIVRSAVFVGR